MKLEYFIKDYVGVAFAFMFAVGSIMIVAYLSSYIVYNLLKEVLDYV